ncbi:MAG: hypothetical protein WAU70_15910 [Flavobacteriales bacterium]
MNDLIETRLATIEKVGTELLEVRFKPEQHVDRAGIDEILNERKRICPEGPRSILAIIPGEPDFDLDVVTTDHYAGRDLENCTRALAIAASHSISERMAGLFFAYFPQAFATKVFSTEGDARRWLQEQVAPRSLS